MTALRNQVRERLQAGELALGFGLRVSRSPDVARIAKTAGFDWLFIDLEHNAMSVETAQQIAATALDLGVTPLVRVPEGEHGLAARLLTGGALGTVMPHVETAADAKAIVELQKFPPLGHRTVSGAMVHFNFEPLPQAEMSKQINAASLIVVMLESQQAINRADDIAAVDGVDVLLIGSGDLSADLGISGDLQHEKMQTCYRTVIAACRKHGKWAGGAGLGRQENIALYVEMGVQFVQVGSDTGFILDGAGARAKFLRRLPLGPVLMKS